jgi:hypothetical protein
MLPIMPNIERHQSWSKRVVTFATNGLAFTGRQQPVVCPATTRLQADGLKSFGTPLLNIGTGAVTLGNATWAESGRQSLSPTGHELGDLLSRLQRLR